MLMSYTAIQTEKPETFSTCNGNQPGVNTSSKVRGP